MRSWHSLALLPFLLTAFASSEKNLGSPWVEKASFPSPATTTTSSMVCLRNAAIAFAATPATTVTYEYRALQDEWIARPNYPSDKNSIGMCLMRTKIIAVGGSPITNAVYSLDLTAPDEWEAQQPMPTARVAPAVACTPEVVYAVGGGPTFGTKMEALVGDVWATKQSPPQSIIKGGATIISRKLYAAYLSPATPTGTNYLSVYSIDTDTWTDVSTLPYPAGTSFSAVSSVGREIFALQYDIIRSINQVATYNVDLDAWTTMTELPSGHSSGSISCYIANLGLLLAVNAGLSPNPVHTMDVGLISFGAVVGDPKFVTFAGEEYHLSLRRGVWNLFTTPFVVVNAMVDIVDTLPPEDNHVMVMIGIIAHFNHTIFLASCSIAADSKSADCSTRSVIPPSSHSTPSLSSTRPLKFPMSKRHKSMHFEFDDIGIMVHPITLSATAIRVGGRTSVHAPSSFLNVQFFPRASPVTPTGLLPDLDSIGVTATRTSLSSYEVDSGCLLSPIVPATASNGFHNAIAVADGIGC